jgi:glucose/arabinose dehydrogenase
MRLSGLLAMALAVALAWGTAQAQPQPARLRGTITAVDGNDVTMTTRDGGTAKIALAADWTATLVFPVAMSDIKQNSFVGTAALPQPDGSLKALEVVVFPEAARGAGEGHRPWDLLPQSTMTNATVTALVQGNDGNTLTLTYKGGSKTVAVGKDTPIVSFRPGDRALVKPGAKAVIFGAIPSGENSYTAKSVLVGQDGMMPPM